MERKSKKKLPDKKKKSTGSGQRLSDPTESGELARTLLERPGVVKNMARRLGDGTMQKSLIMDITRCAQSQYPSPARTHARMLFTKAGIPWDKQIGVARKKDHPAG